MKLSPEIYPSSTGCYGSIVPRTMVPITWDLNAGETWTFEFPTGNVVFYDPNLTPTSASPTSNDFVEIV